MWLLDTGTLELKEFLGVDIPPYAILSHTWGVAEDEISFRDMRKFRDAAELKKGYMKVKRCCLKAAQDGYRYAWIDSCCIDKRSSAELSEAINSMFRYYQNAQVCYAYLADVPSLGVDLSLKRNDDAFSKSCWFTRGWTLQELIAPGIVQFFGEDWTWIGTKEPRKKGLRNIAESNPPDDLFLPKLAKITGVGKEILQDCQKIWQTSVAQRMSWAARRQTTRGEDTAYSLMGLFDIHMPILYGEGEIAAFQRLQLQIMQSVPDQSLFAWRANRESSGLLAESPRDFAASSTMQIRHPWITTGKPWLMTNTGLYINLRMSMRKDVSGKDVTLATLRCWTHIGGDKSDTESERVRIYLRRVQRPSRDGSLKPVGDLYRREKCNTFIMAGPASDLGSAQDIYVLEDSHFQVLDY